MTIALWILAYLAVGFVVAVLVERRRTRLWYDATVLYLLCFWFVVPLSAVVFALMYIPLDRHLRPLVRWCARRLP